MSGSHRAALASEPDLRQVVVEGIGMKGQGTLDWTDCGWISSTKHTGGCWEAGNSAFGVMTKLVPPCCTAYGFS